AAAAAPTEIRIEHVPLVTIGFAEMLTDLCHAVELVLGRIFRAPIAAVVREVELLAHRMPVETNRVADANGNVFTTGAVEIYTPDLAVILVVQHIVARLPDRDVEFHVRSNGNELPAMRLVLWQIGVDHRRLRRLVEDVLDIFDL